MEVNKYKKSLINIKNSKYLILLKLKFKNFKIIIF